MVRVDVWDIPRADTDESILIGLPQTFHERYVLGEQLGRGGFGVVPPCTHPLPIHVDLNQFSLPPPGWALTTIMSPEGSSCISLLF